jgi:hypothetical protein
VVGFKIRALDGVLERRWSDSTLDDGNLLSLDFLVDQIWVGGRPRLFLCITRRSMLETSRHH